MQPQTETKIVLITRPTRLAELVVRFNTVGQARFYLEHAGVDFSDYEAEQERYDAAVREAHRLLAACGRVQILERRFLPNFIFGPQDTVVALGQDGLVANTLKYLDGQPLIGVNPDPLRWDGQLLPFGVPDLATLVPEVLAGGRPTRAVTMAQATLNTGQVLYAVNDLFIGIRSHGSARYRIQVGDAAEEQSSSGIVISTGLGSTGWLRSLVVGAVAVNRLAQTFVAAGRASPLGSGESGGGGGVASWQLPWDAEYLFYTVREPFPSRRTGCNLVFGRVSADSPLTLESHMPEQGIIFSDGLEQDYLEFNSGTRATIGLSSRRGALVV